MRNLIGAVAAVVLGSLAYGAPANAATMMGTTGTPLSEAIKNSHGADADANFLTFESDPSGYLIDYSSTSILHYNGSSGGFAQVTGPGAGGGVGFADLTITPQSVNFTEFKFNLQIPASEGSFDPPNGYQTNFTFGTTVFFAGGGSQFFDVDVGTGTGMNRFLIAAGLDELINKIVFSNLVGVSTKNNDPTLINSYNFDSIRQVSFNAVSGVPEPQTWTLFILGFGTVGYMLRRRRQVVSPA
jgi:hypothetical protein